MPAISQFRVRKKGSTAMHLSWRMARDANLNILAVVLRSESRFGPFDEITSPFSPVQVTELSDPLQPIAARRKWYYALRLIELDRGHVQEKKEWQYPEVAVTDEPDDDPEAALIANDLDMVMRQQRQVIYFPSRSAGGPCDCVDQTTGEKLRRGCLRCMGSGVVGGYLRPLRLGVKTVNDQSVPSARGATVGRSMIVMLPWYVDPKEGDLIVEVGDLRWRVVDTPESPIFTEYMRRSVLYHRCMVSVVPAGGVEYELPVPDEISEAPFGWQYS